ncbi:DNA binding protein [Aureococcus anophagefferens]|nr:DNA binding protein [Aureococcus anophagefferens]
MRRLVAPWLALALVGVDAAIVVITPSDDSNCANEGYSDITSVSDCEAAIADANADMGLSGYGSPSSVSYSFYPTGCYAGCYSDYTGYFCTDYNTDQNSLTSTDGDKYLFCESSGAASSGGIGVVNPTTDGSKTCEDIGYCTITSLSDCEAAIDEANAAIGASSSGSPSSVSYSFYPTGCYAGCYSSYSGYYCTAYNSHQSSLTATDGDKYLICQSGPCPTPPTPLPTPAGTQPFQLLKATGDDYYSLMRLDDGVYVDIFDLDYTDANDINAAAMYTDADGSFYPYAVFDSQLCRFDRYSVHCYDGTMGVDLANAAAIVGGDRRDHFYYSNALGEKKGDGLWYASDLDASHPTFHDLTLPVNSDLFSSTVVDFAPATEDSGSDDIIADGVAGATYVREAASSARALRVTLPAQIIGMMYDFRLFIARLGDDGAGATRSAVVVRYSTSTDTPDNDGLNCPTDAADSAIEAFNCTRAGTQPFQLLKATDDDYYS